MSGAAASKTNLTGAHATSAVPGRLNWSTLLALLSFLSCRKAIGIAARACPATWLITN